MTHQDELHAAKLEGWKEAMEAVKKRTEGRLYLSRDALRRAKEPDNLTTNEMSYCRGEVNELLVMKGWLNSLLPPSDGTPARRKIVCLCGSTRFKDAYDEANYRETMAGNIVLSVGFFMHASGNRHGEGIGATPEQKVELDRLHKDKIAVADEVLILNVGGYIGESTRSELEFAREHNKTVRWLEPDKTMVPMYPPAREIPEPGTTEKGEGK